MSVRSILVGPLPVPSQVGDAAIAAGAVVLLREAFPSAHICGWSSRVDTANERVVESFIRTYGVDSVIYNPLSFSSPAQHGRLADLGGALAKYALPSLGRVLGRHALRLPMGAMREMAQAIADADLVVMRGGGYLSSPHLLCDLWGLRLNSLSEVAIARGLGVPYAIWGHTIWDLNGPLSKRILWPLIRDSQVTACREQRSYDYLVSAGAPEDRLVVLPDTAFALKPAPDERVAEIFAEEGLDSVDAPLIGVNVRPPWDVKADYDELKPRYLAATAATIEHLHDRYGIHAVLISHCHNNELHSVPDFQDERQLQMELAEQVRSADAVHVLTGEYTPAELVGVYGRLEMMMTTRLHAGILSAVAGTPAAFVAYEKNKTYGIASMLGLTDYVTDIQTVSEAGLKQVAEGLWNERDEVTSRLQKQLAGIRYQLSQYQELTKTGSLAKGGDRSS